MVVREGSGLANGRDSEAVEPDSSRSGGRADGSRRPARRFAVGLALVLLVALIVRMWFALAVAADLPPGIDADYYHVTAESLADGDGYNIRPANIMWSTTDDVTVLEPAGNHPPLHATLLAASNLVGLESYDGHRAFLAVLSCVGVALVGLLGRRVGGQTVGLVAAGIVAVHPLWFQYAGFLSSEITYTVAVPAVMWAGVRAIDRPGVRSMAVLGAAIGLASLTRSEAMLFLLVLGAPVAWVATGRRLRSFGTVVACCAVVIAPWMLWMHSTYGVWSLSMNGGGTISIANCPEAYDGPDLGSVGCGLGQLAKAGFEVSPDLEGPAWTAEFDAIARQQGIDYALGHKRKLPKVLAARAGRTLGIYRVDRLVTFDRGIGSHPPTQRVGIGANWVLMALAAAGAVVVWRHRNRRHLMVLAAGPVVAMTTGILIYGATRMRISAEPAIAVLAAVAVVTAVRRVLTARSSSPADVVDPA